jgi:hypothetical protein
MRTDGALKDELRRICLVAIALVLAVAAFQPLLQPLVVEARKPVRYQYRVREATGAAGAETLLNAMSQDGWELVSTHLESDPRLINQSTVIAVFRK